MSSTAASIRLFRSKIGEFNAEPTAVREGYEENRVREAEIRFSDVATENVFEERNEALPRLGPDEQVYSWPKLRRHL